MCDAAQQAMSDAARAAGTAPDNTQLEGVLATMSSPMTADQYAFCLSANASSTQASMLIICAIYALAAIAFIVCARRLRRDLLV